MRRHALVFAALVACAPLAAAAAGETPPPWHYDLEQHLMSPYCPGRTLTDCTSPQAAELREWIASQEQAGRSRADVEAQLYREFGEVILQAPRAEGFGLAAYVIPAVGVLLGASLVFVFLRRQSARAAAAAPAPAAGVDPELDRLIDEEMRRSGTPAR
jgi:cytochrome c-type biogenesis protein CcmH/NrfF